VSGNVTGHIAEDHRSFFMGSAHVGQIDVVVAGMIPVPNVEAKARHAAVLVAPQQLDPEDSFDGCQLGRLRFGELAGVPGPFGVPRTPRCW